MFIVIPDDIFEILSIWFKCYYQALIFLPTVQAVFILLYFLTIIFGLTGIFFISSSIRSSLRNHAPLLVQQAKRQTVASVALNCCNIVNATQGNSRNAGHSRKKQTNNAQKKFQENMMMNVIWKYMMAVMPFERMLQFSQNKNIYQNQNATTQQNIFPYVGAFLDVFDIKPKPKCLIISSEPGNLAILVTVFR